MLTIDWIYYCVTLFLSLFLSVIPFLPNLHVAEWFMNLAFISIALLKVFESSYLVVPKPERENAYKATTKEQLVLIDQAQGTFWGPIHKLTHVTNEFLWNSTDFIRGRVFRAEKSSIVRLIVIEIFGGLVL